MSDRTYGVEEKAKLQRLVDEGVTVLQEIEDLQAGLKDTVKSVAEELDMKPSVINKAIRIAYKNEFAQVQEGFSQVEEVLAAVGKDH